MLLFYCSHVVICVTADGLEPEKCPLSPKEFWTGREAGGEFILVTAVGAWKAVRSNIVRLRINSHMQDAGTGMQNLELTQSGEQQRLLWSARDVTFATVLSEIHWFGDCTSAE